MNFIFLGDLFLQTSSCQSLLMDTGCFFFSNTRSHFKPISCNRKVENVKTKPNLVPDFQSETLTDTLDDAPFNIYALLFFTKMSNKVRSSKHIVFSGDIIFSRNKDQGLCSLVQNCRTDSCCLHMIKKAPLQAHTHFV